MTPGPWKAIPKYSTSISLGGVESETHGHIATLEDYDDADEDARLIAAAPEMLGALKAFVDGSYYQTADEAHDLMLRARKHFLEIIAQAEGRS